MIVHHCPPYTNGWDSDGYAGDMDTRNYLVPLYEQYGVDLVIAGHTHDYERGILNGVHYVITGGGGSGLDHKVNDFQHIHIYNAIYHYIQMDISKNNIVYEVFDTLGNIVDDTLFSKGPDEILNNVSLPGDTLKPGEITSITWNTENTNGNAEVRLYSDNKNYTLINEVDITKKEFSWNISKDLENGKYIIKIKQDYLESSSAEFILDDGGLTSNYINYKNIHLFDIHNIDNRNIMLTLPSNYKTEISFFDLRGKNIYSIKRQFNSGNNVINLSRNIFPNGIIIVKAKYGNKTIKKQILLK